MIRKTPTSALARTNGEACVQIFFVRSGKLIGREYFILEGTEDEKNEAILKEFIKQFYSQAAFIPNRVLLPTEVEEARIIKEWLNTAAAAKNRNPGAKRGKNKAWWTWPLKTQSKP